MWRTKWGSFTNPSEPTGQLPFRHYGGRFNGQAKKTGDAPEAGTVAIIIPVRNGLKFFKLCFHSLLSFTDHPYMISVIDHLGDLATKKHFRYMENNHPVYLHRYDGDFNYSAEVNLGLREAFKFPTVEYGLILNADTIVGPHWLSSMIAVMQSNPRIGVVGPRSNHALPEQEIPFDHDTRCSRVQRLSGMCMLFRREVWEEVGGFDEQFIGGGFEDWDFCERAQRLGWSVMLDHETYVHHYHRVFRGHEREGELDANEARFFKKHPLVHDLVVRGNLVRKESAHAGDK